MSILRLIYQVTNRSFGSIGGLDIQPFDNRNYNNPPDNVINKFNLSNQLNLLTCEITSFPDTGAATNFNHNSSSQYLFSSIGDL